MKTIDKARHTFYGLLLGLLVSSPASAITLSQTPLFITGSASPNVMLLIDTSGSMYNTVWPDAYDPDTPYERWDWNYPDEGGLGVILWGPETENVRHENLRKKSPCGSDGIEGENEAGIKKCLTLPDPAPTTTRFHGNYLNYLFATYPDKADLTTGVIPLETRLDVAKATVADLLDQTSGVRFGIAEFAGDQGAQIDRGCGADLTDIKSTLNAYDAVGSTPLAESLYEITRYFRGMEPYYSSYPSDSDEPGLWNKTSGKYETPIHYRCQRNFSVVVTDGLPQNDFSDGFPTDISDEPYAAKLPDWDGDTTEPPPDVDGDYLLYLDDIAQFGYDIDMMDSGTDAAGVSFNDSEFPQQNMTTYTIGFAQDNQMLDDAAANSDGKYFTADDASTLSNALNQTMESIQLASQASSAAVATNSTRLDTQTIIYQARFNATDWTGDLIAFSIDYGTGEVNTTPTWTAASKLPPATGATPASNRKIYSYDAGNTTGIEFLAPSDYTSPASGEMNSSMINSLLANAPYSSATVDTTEQSANQTYLNELVTYLRGNTGSGGAYNGGFRERESVLGDIVNSNPFYVGTRDFGYGAMAGTEGTDYLAFRADTDYQARTPVVYVGANDGMLHAFNAITGEEMFAYVPSVVYPNLPALADPAYSHQYYVNGSPRASDAYVNGTWKTILVGATGAGGRGIFALDVTSPGTFDETNVLGEFTSANDADVGYVLGQPTIARMEDGTYAAIFGNGYNSANNRAVLFIVSLNDGTVLKKFDTLVGDATTPNGLGAPIPVDIDGDRTTDYIYAGDLLGNMWKFDVDDSNTGQWKIVYKNGSAPAPLFQAKDASSNPQPITVRPSIGSHPDGGLMVYFGTGQYFASGDNVIPASPQVQSFYGIWDNGVKVTGRSALQAQSIIYEEYGVTFGTEVHDVRAISANDTNYSTKKGWYLDLKPPSGSAKGERVVNDAVLRNGRIIFTTLIPSGDPCGYGGYSWLMEMDAVSGARFDYSVFDLNGDGKFTAGEFVKLSDGTWVPVSGKGYEEIVSQPVVIDAGEKEHKYVSGSSGDISHVTEKGDYYKGRQSWRQLR